MSQKKCGFRRFCVISADPGCATFHCASLLGGDFTVSNETDEICCAHPKNNEKRLLFPKFILLSNFHCSICSIRLHFSYLKFRIWLINGGSFQKTECHDMKKKNHGNVSFFMVKNFAYLVWLKSFCFFLKEEKVFTPGVD